MKNFYMYPAIFYKEEQGFTAVFPDLNIFIDGATMEEAYLFAKEYLRTYCVYAEKYDLEIIIPSSFQNIQDRFPNNHVELIDVEVSVKDKIKR